MKLKDYIKEVQPILLGWLGSLVIFNLVIGLIEIATVSKADLIYMDGLCLICFVSGFGYHYFRKMKVYQRLEGLMLENRKLEEQLRLLQDLPEFALTYKILTYQKQQYIKHEAHYKEKLENMTDYTMQIVHDLKVNLAVCEMIAKRVPLEDREKLSYEIEQMKFRVGQMLYVARANEYNEDIRAEYFQIQEVLRNAIKENAEFFMNQNIELEVEVKPYEVLNDQKWVLYILSQILNNSSKYTREGGKVQIFSREDERAYSVHLKDNGIGIAEEDLSRIFDKGYTGSNGRLNTKATGMGLYYAKKMAKVLNIGLTVESQLGEYTEFTLAFYKHSDYMMLQEEK